MTQNLILGTASLEDIPTLCELLAELFDQEQEFTPNVDAQTRGLRAIIENPQTGVVLIAQIDARIVGMVTLLWVISTALGGRAAILEDMIVTGNARQRGIGRQLLAYAIATARQEGAKRITLLTDSDNSDAQRFYQQQGFEQSAMLPFRLLL